MELVSKQQVAEVFGVSERTIELMVKRGEFPPPLRLGKSARWAAEVPQRWLAAKLAPQMNWKPRCRA